MDAPAALGFAPLHLAVGHGHLRATQALLRGGAAPDVRCKGHLFLTYAPPGRYKPMSTPLHIAAFCQSLPLAHSILSQQVLTFQPARGSALAAAALGSLLAYGRCARACQT